MRAYKIAIPVSGPGTNFRNIPDAMDRGDFQSKALSCHSNKGDIYGLERAKKYGISCLVSRGDDEVLQALENRGIDLIVLVGYLRILSGYFLENSKGLILNIHPSFLPKYGNMGIYGIYVHGTVYAHGKRESGAIVHPVTGVMSGRQIIFQEPAGIENCHSLKEVQAKVLKIEYRLLPRVVVHLEEV